MQVEECGPFVNYTIPVSEDGKMGITIGAEPDTGVIGVKHFEPAGIYTTCLTPEQAIEVITALGHCILRANHNRHGKADT